MRMANFICAGDGINRTARSVRKTQTARFCMGMDRGKSEQHAEEVRKSDQLNREKGSRDSVPCGVWGNAPTVPRATSMPTALNKGAGSEASLPVTLRSRRSAPKLLYPPLAHCRAKWARPHSRSTAPCPCFPLQTDTQTQKDTRKTSGTKPLVFSISRNIHFFSSAR